MTTDSEPKTTVLGSGNFRYDVIPNWEQLPQDWSFYEAVGVATDSQDRVYVFNRGEYPLIVFDVIRSSHNECGNILTNCG